MFRCVLPLQIDLFVCVIKTGKPECHIDNILLITVVNREITEDFTRCCRRPRKWKDFYFQKKKRESHSTQPNHSGACQLNLDPSVLVPP
uniref:Secreted protein n=1 Tax=Trichuris muris TaxID=70415 RepID=A0A5S6R4U6_TRIMR